MGYCGRNYFHRTFIWIGVGKMNTNNKAYIKVLEHRRTCSKWGKEFCMQCFGGGLTRFINNYIEEDEE